MSPSFLIIEVAESSSIALTLNMEKHKYIQDERESSTKSAFQSGHKMKVFHLNSLFSIYHNLSSHQCCLGPSLLDSPSLNFIFHQFKSSLVSQLLHFILSFFHEDWVATIHGGERAREEETRVRRREGEETDGGVREVHLLHPAQPGLPQQRGGRERGRGDGRLGGAHSPGQLECSAEQAVWEGNIFFRDKKNNCLPKKNILCKSSKNQQNISIKKIARKISL